MTNPRYFRTFNDTYYEYDIASDLMVQLSEPLTEDQRLNLAEGMYDVHKIVDTENDTVMGHLMIPDRPDLTLYLIWRNIMHELGLTKLNTNVKGSNQMYSMIYYGDNRSRKLFFVKEGSTIECSLVINNSLCTFLDKNGLKKVDENQQEENKDIEEQRETEQNNKNNKKSKDKNKWFNSSLKYVLIGGLFVGLGGLAMRHGHFRGI
jgi:hypothetical protein